MNHEGKVIPGEQRGLVLYKRGGTLCLNPLNIKGLKGYHGISGYLMGGATANAICKEMNFASASWFKITDSYEFKKDFDRFSFYPELAKVACPTPDWKNCTFDKSPGELEYCASMKQYLVLSCSGNAIAHIQ